MKKIFTLLLATVCLNTAQAGLYLEPYLGYAFGSSETKGRNSTLFDSEFSYKTPYLGARVGYGMMGLSVGVDYSFTMADYDTDISVPANSTSTDEFGNKALGIFANFDAPVLPLRVWATYFLNWESETKKSTTLADVGDTESGKGFGLGVGFTGLPFLAINLELRQISIDESKDASSGVTTAYPSTNHDKPEYREIILSVSAPFDF